VDFANAAGVPPVRTFASRADFVNAGVGTIGIQVGISAGCFDEQLPPNINMHVAVL
jgi:hypothetical protein